MCKDIPLPKLEEGIEKGMKHIQEMNESSRILLESGHHSISIAISVLAHEELAKLRDMVVHLRDKKPITWMEWKELSRGGSHGAKLVKLHKDALNDVIQRGEAHHKDVQELHRKIGANIPMDFPTRADMERQISIFKNLNDVKKECVYLDWKDGDWITFETNTNTDERAALAEVLCIQNLLTFVTVQLEHRHPTVSSDERSSGFKAYQNDPIRMQMIAIEEYCKTKTVVEKIQTATSVINRYSNRARP